VQNLQWAWRADRLNALDIARPLTYEQRLEIAKAMKVLTFEAGDVICDAGDHSDSFSVLQRGKVVLEGTNQTCRVFSKGDAIGEWAHGTVRN
jgi:CRP-like cAMP-binding protein